MTTQLTGFAAIAGQQILSSSSTQMHPVGTYMETNDGRGFRYFLNGAVSTVPGKIYQSAAQDTTNLNPSGGLAVAASAIGATTVTLTGSLTLAANLLANGLMGTDVTPGQGYTYLVQSNTAVAGAANCVVTLADPLIIALTTSSKVVFQLNPYSGAIVLPTTATGAPIGVAPFIVVNAQYGWLQTHGPAALLNDSGTAVGLGVAPSAATAGSVKTMAATLAQVGYALGTQVTTEYNFVFLTID
jgi:hypothetical protein